MFKKITSFILTVLLLVGSMEIQVQAVEFPKIVLRGGAVDSQRIDLYWNAQPISDVSQEVEGKFEVYRDGLLFKEYNQVYTVLKYRIPHSSCDYPVEELTSHRYYVKAYDIDGNFLGQSNEVEVTTPAQHTFDYLPAFPDAAGFGAVATGGRGGRVVYVTNLNSSGPGSLRDALTQTGPRYIIFKVSGIINTGGWWNMIGDYTLAGHTSRGGVITRGFITSAKEDPNYKGMNNVIIRHLRSRPDSQITNPASYPGGYTPTEEELTWGMPGGWDDAFRLIQTKEVILDHCSFGRAGDETMQVACSNYVTIQDTILSEAIGEHYGLGGMLINYTTTKQPQNNLSIHHNMWNRVGGRLPEISNNSGYANDHVFNYEISNNLIWDPAGVIWVNETGKPYNHQDNLYLDLNMIGNYMRTRDDFRSGLIVQSILQKGNSLYLSDNKMSLYPLYSDYQLVYGNTDFFRYHPNSKVGEEIRRVERHPYAPITYTDSDELIDYMIGNVGAFPRDTMDRRLISYLEKNEIDPKHWSARPANDGLLFDWETPPPPPLDSDDDGMPDWWEIHNGLNPLVQDHNQKNLSLLYTGVEGYDNLEVYLNRLSDNLVSGISLTEGPAHTYPVTIQSAVSSVHSVTAGENTAVTFTVTPADSNLASSVELSLDNLSAPYSSPSPEAVTAIRSGNSWVYTYTIPANRDPGDYQVMAHVEYNNGEHGYAIIPMNIHSSGTTPPVTPTPKPTPTPTSTPKPTPTPTPKPTSTPQLNPPVNPPFNPPQPPSNPGFPINPNPDPTPGLSVTPTPTTTPTPTPMVTFETRKGTGKQVDTEVSITTKKDIINTSIKINKKAILAKADKNTAKGKTLKIVIPITSEKLVKQAGSKDTKKIKINCSIATSILDNKNIHTNIQLPKELLTEAAKGKKDINITVSDDKGKELYTWTFSGNTLAASKKKVEDITLSIIVEKARDNPAIVKLLKISKQNTSSGNPYGLIISTGQLGYLPTQAKVKIYVGDLIGTKANTGLKANQKIYLYRYNKATGKLETLPYTSKYKIDKNGYITVNLLEGADYVLLPKAEMGSRITSLINQVSVTPRKVSLYVGGKKGTTALVKLGLPATLELTSSLKAKTSGSAVGAVTATYKSKNKAIVTVNSKGKLTAKGTGKTTIEVKLKLYNGKTRTVKISVTVKKPK